MVLVQAKSKAKKYPLNDNQDLFQRLEKPGVSFVLVRVNFFLGKVIVVLGWIQPVLNVLAIGTNQAARSRNAVQSLWLTPVGVRWFLVELVVRLLVAVLRSASRRIHQLAFGGRDE